MEKKINAYKANSADFISFVDRMNNWRLKNVNQVVDSCRKVDIDASGSLEYDTFKLGSTNLNCIF